MLFDVYDREAGVFWDTGRRDTLLAELGFLARAKLVRAEFTQAIDEHWSRRPLQRNRLALGS